MAIPSFPHNLYDLFKYFYSGQCGIQLTSSVIGDEYGVSSVFESLECVLRAHDPFGDDWQPADPLDLRDDLPADVHIFVVLDVLSEPRILAGGLHVGRLPLVLVVVGHPEALWQLEAVPDVVLALPEYLRVNRQVEGLVPRVLDPCPQVLVDLCDLRQVDLEKLQRAGRLGCHVLQRRGGPRTQLEGGVQVAIGCTRGRKLALRRRHTVEGRRGDADRGLDCVTQDGRGCRDRG